jgi:L-alanine-DL-glutamate epimerase-like enolase superfamily enzyme
MCTALQIVDVKAFYIEIPLPEPIDWSAIGLGFPHMKSDKYPFVLVKVLTDKGITGIGASVCFGNGREVVTYINDVIKPYLIEVLVDPFNIGGFQRMLDWSAFMWNRSYAVEIALWDVIGKYLKQPIYRLLGACQDKVKAYASLLIETPKKTVENVVERMKEGFLAVKLRVRSQDLRKNLEVIKSVKDVVGDKIEIMVDANQAWNVYPPTTWSRQTALKMARELEKLDVIWLEEPLPKDDLEGLAKLSEKVDIPIAGGEFEYGIYRFRELLEKKVYDIIQPDVTLSGGILGVKKIATLAEAWNIMCIPHAWSIGIGFAASLQLIGSLPNCPYIEFPHAPPRFSFAIRDVMLKEPIRAENGYVEIPKRPGLGIDLNEEVIAKYKVE